MRTAAAEQRFRPELLHALDHAAPRVHHVVEVSAPDVSQVLRRAEDQFLLGPSPRVSETPSGSLSASASGAAQLTASAATLADLTGLTGGMFHLNPLVAESDTRRLKAFRWAPARSFRRGVLRRFTARIERYLWGGYYLPANFELQIYRASAVPGIIKETGEQWVEWTHTPLLTPPATFRHDQIVWNGSQQADLVFDLTSYGLPVDNLSGTIKTLGEAAGEVNAYYFVVRPVGVRLGGLFGWLLDNTSSRTSVGVGSFVRAWWSRESDREEWTQTTYPDVPAAKLEIDSYAASAQAVYVVDMGAVPAAASVGRVVFERSVPTGATGTLELSTAGAAGPWAVVKHGDAVALQQQLYHLRLTLAPTAANRESPLVFGLGIEWRRVIDVTEESVGEALPMDVGVPWLEGAIGESRLRVLRTGRRDYEDTATQLGSEYAPATLEVDHYLASSHPAVTREHWYHLSRATVSNRVPNGTGEDFTLLSYLSRLARKVPRKTETISTVHTVASATTTAVVVTAGAFLDYAGKGYYMRVRSSAAASVDTGAVATIDGNTGATQLDFTTPLEGTLLAGDVIEVHSATYITVPLQWVDADPAVVWWELLTVHGAIPPERIGRAGMGARGGLPPTVAMIAPGDSAHQAKLKVTVHLAQQQALGELLDQLSVILGGATTEVAGQIVFVQVHPLRDASGDVTVIGAAPAFVHDPRDYTDLSCPPGLEQRTVLVAAGYGVNPTAVGSDATPTSVTDWVDADALAWHTQPDVDALGTAEVPENVTRWLYNSADKGLTLASEIARRLCLAGSTGLRVWEWTTTELQPELAPGDVGFVITDEATDYDPASAAPIRGWAAWRVVLLGVAGNRRRLRGWVLGLAGNVTALQGGRAGALGGTDTAAIAVPTVLYAIEKRGRATSWVAYLVASFTTPATPYFDHMEYAVEQRPMPTAAEPNPSWSAPVVVRGTREGPDHLPVQFNVQVRVTPYTVSSGGTRTAGAPSAIYAVPGNPAPEVLTILPFATASYVEFTIEVDDDTQLLHVYLEERGTDPGTAPDLADGTRVALVLDRRLFADNVAVVRQELASAGNYACLSVVPLDGLNDPGTETHAYAQGNAVALLPLAPASGAQVSTTTTTATISATLQNPWTAGGSPAPTHLRLYRGGVLASEAVIAVAAGGTQNLTATGLNPGTAYTNWEVATVASGVESTRVAVPGTATTAALTLDAPTSVVLTRGSGGAAGALTLTWAAGANNPSGTTYVLEQNNGPSGTGGWDVIETAWASTTYNAGANFIPTTSNPTPDQFRLRAESPGATTSAYTTSNLA